MSELRGKISFGCIGYLQPMLPATDANNGVSVKYSGNNLVHRLNTQICASVRSRVQVPAHAWQQPNTPIHTKKIKGFCLNRKPGCWLHQCGTPKKTTGPAQSQTYTHAYIKNLQLLSSLPRRTQRPNITYSGLNHYGMHSTVVVYLGNAPLCRLTRQ